MENKTKYKDQKDLHNKIRKKLVEIEELASKSEVYYSYDFDEEIERLDLTVKLNELIREVGIPERFKIYSCNIDDGNFLGFNIDNCIDNCYEEGFDRKRLTRIAKKALPYLSFIDAVLEDTKLDLIVDSMYIEYSNSVNDIEYMKFIITDKHASLFNNVIKIKKTSANKFKLLYLKNSHNLYADSQLIITDYGDKWISHVEITDRDNVLNNESSIILSRSTDLSEKISDAVDNIHFKFNELSDKYNNFKKGNRY